MSTGVNCIARDRLQRERVGNDDTVQRHPNEYRGIGDRVPDDTLYFRLEADETNILLLGVTNEYIGLSRYGIGFRLNKFQREQDYALCVSQQSSPNTSCKAKLSACFGLK